MEIATVWSSSTILSFKTRIIAKVSLVSEAMSTVGVTSSTTVSSNWLNWISARFKGSYELLR